MNITLNGQARRLDDGITIGELLQVESLGERKVAVEVNGQIIPRGQHAVHALRPDDKVEIVHALGGG